METCCIDRQEENAALVRQRAEAALDKILDESGTLLYSSCATLAPGKYYFLGLNPGGKDAGTNTIRQSLRELNSHCANAYLDEDWGGDSRAFGMGRHPLQKNFRALFEALGEDPRVVCASNLIFSRSIGERGAGGRCRANLCWPVHQTILSIVNPVAIVTFGRQPFNFILEKLGGTVPMGSPAGHGSWKWRQSRLATGQTLVGLPHLSRYALSSHKGVLAEIKELLQSKRFDSL